MKNGLHKQSELTAEQLREVLDYDPATGEFRWKRSRYAQRIGTLAGSTLPAGYRTLVVNRSQYLAHRLAWLFMTGSWPEHTVDHRNGRRDDNRWHNLRHATMGENSQNKRRALRRNTGGLLGVSFCSERGNWRAMIMANGKSHYLGRYPTKEEAHEVYLKAKERLHPFQTLVPAQEAA